MEPQSVDVSPRHGEIEGTRLKRIFKGGRWLVVVGGG